MASAFYLFKLPSVWEKHLAFAVTVSGAEINEDPSETFALCCSVMAEFCWNNAGDLGKPVEGGGAEP